MMIFIGASEVLDNAFYVFTKRTNKREISIKKIMKYAHSVVETLEKRNIQATLLFSTEMLTNFYVIHISIYEKKITQNGTFIVLKEDVSIDELNNKYIDYPIKLLVEALRSEENIKELFWQH